MNDRNRPPNRPASMAVPLLAFIVGALLLLPGFVTTLCATMTPIPTWLGRLGFVLLLVGLPLTAWAFWRMIR